MFGLIWRISTFSVSFLSCVWHIGQTLNPVLLSLCTVSSTFFEDLFSCSKWDVKEIVFLSLKFTDLKNIVHFMYTGNSDNFEELIEVGSQFGVKGLPKPEVTSDAGPEFLVKVVDSQGGKAISQILNLNFFLYFGWINCLVNY